MILLGLIGAAGIQAQQSINLHMSSGFVFIPEGLSPFNNLTNLRLDGRIHGWISDSARRNVVNFSAANNFYVAIFNGFLLVTDGYDNQGLQIPLAGYGSDIIWRFNRDTAAKRVSLELWNANGSNYSAS